MGAAKGKEASSKINVSLTAPNMNADNEEERKRKWEMLSLEAPPFAFGSRAKLGNDRRADGPDAQQATPTATQGAQQATPTGGPFGEGYKSALRDFCIAIGIEEQQTVDASGEGVKSIYDIFGIQAPNVSMGNTAVIHSNVLNNVATTTDMSSKSPIRDAKGKGNRKNRLSSICSFMY